MCTASKFLESKNFFLQCSGHSTKHTPLSLIWLPLLFEFISDADVLPLPRIDVRTVLRDASGLDDNDQIKKRNLSLVEMDVSDNVCDACREESYGGKNIRFC